MNAARIYNVDSLEAMRDIPAGYVDAIVTDPPWNVVGLDLGWLGIHWWRKIVYEMERIVGDKGKIIIHLGSRTDPRPFIESFSLPFIHLCFLRYSVPRYRGNILDNGDVLYQFGRGFLPSGSRVLPQLHTAVTGAEKPKIDWHPCPRALAHVDWIIRTQVGSGRVVFDPFLGAGTTGVAAVKNGCEFIGFEMMPEWATRARERIEAAEMGLTVCEVRGGQESMFPTHTQEA